MLAYSWWYPARFSSPVVHKRSYEAGQGLPSRRSSHAVDPSRYKICDHFETGGVNNPGCRQLALAILCERFDYGEAYRYHETFASDFLSHRLARGEHLWIYREDINAWWAMKEDMQERHEYATV